MNHSVTKLIWALLVATVVLAVMSGLILQQLQRIRTELTQAPPGPAVVYIRDGQGSIGVPVHSIASREAQTGYLPNFTEAVMICWEDAEDSRWFRIRPVLGVTQELTVMVLAEHVHNQLRVDHC